MSTRTLSDNEQTHEQTVTTSTKPRAKAKRPKPRWRIVERLQEALDDAVTEQLQAWALEHATEASAAALVPKKWELVGDICVLQGLHSEELQAYPELCEALGNAVLSEMTKARLVCVDSGVVKGELRQPSEFLVLATRKGCDDSTETVHKESGILFSLDVAHIMFASGNGTERTHWAQIDACGHTVVDMFAGIGYFSVPLAKNNAHMQRLVCIEKNTVSFGYLQQNMALNKVDPEECNVILLCGDNREEGDAYLHTAHRISMGYIPTPIGFIGRALDFAVVDDAGTPCVIHYHYTSTKDESHTLPLEHFQEQSAAWSLEQQHYTVASMQLLEVRKIKAYAPQLFHYVAEIQVVVQQQQQQQAAASAEE